MNWSRTVAVLPTDPITVLSSSPPTSLSGVCTCVPTSSGRGVLFHDGRQGEDSTLELVQRSLARVHGRRRGHTRCIDCCVDVVRWSCLSSVFRAPQLEHSESSIIVVVTTTASSRSSAVLYVSGGLGLLRRLHKSLWQRRRRRRSLTLSCHTALKLTMETQRSEHVVPGVFQTARGFFGDQQGTMFNFLYLFMRKSCSRHILRIVSCA